jgi:hypothetical protein
MKNQNAICVSCALLLLSASLVWAAQDVVTAVHGTITKLDSGTKAMVVRTIELRINNAMA